MSRYTPSLRILSSTNTWRRVGSLQIADPVGFTRLSPTSRLRSRSPLGPTRERMRVDPERHRRVGRPRRSTTIFTSCPLRSLPLATQASALPTRPADDLDAVMPVNSAATSIASLFVPRTVGETCVGLPDASRPVKAPTSRLPACVREESPRPTRNWNPLNSGWPLG